MKTVVNSIINNRNIHQWLGLVLSLSGIAYYGFHNMTLASIATTQDTVTNIVVHSQIDPVIAPLAVKAPIYANPMPLTADNISIEALQDIQGDLTVAQVTEIFQHRFHGKMKAKAKPLARHLMKLSQRYHFSPSILVSVIQSESSFRVTAESNVHAMGLMQIKPSTAAYIAKKDKIKTYHVGNDLFDPFVNLSIGTAYLAYLREQFGNSVQYVAAYNLGPTTVHFMVHNNQFALGKVAKYVTEIHAMTRDLRAHGLNTILAFE